MERNSKSKNNNNIIFQNSLKSTSKNKLKATTIIEKEKRTSTRLPNHQPFVNRIVPNKLPKATPHSNVKTFQRFLEVETWKRPEIKELENIMLAIGASCQGISSLIRRAQTDDISGLYGDDKGVVNVQ